MIVAVHVADADVEARAHSLERPEAADQTVGAAIEHIDETQTAGDRGRDDVEHAVAGDVAPDNLNSAQVRWAVGQEVGDRAAGAGVDQGDVWLRTHRRADRLDRHAHDGLTLHRQLRTPPFGAMSLIWTVVANVPLLL